MISSTLHFSIQVFVFAAWWWSNGATGTYHRKGKKWKYVVQMVGFCGFKSLQFSVVGIQAAVLCLILRTSLQLLVSSRPYHASWSGVFICWHPRGRVLTHVVSKSPTAGIQSALALCRYANQSSAGVKEAVLYLVLWTSLRLLVSKRPCDTSIKPCLRSCRVEGWGCCGVPGVEKERNLITGSLIDRSHTRTVNWGHVRCAQTWQAHPLLSAFNTLHVLIIHPRETGA